MLLGHLLRVLVHKPHCLVLNGASVVPDLELGPGHARLGEMGGGGSVVVVVEFLYEKRVTPSWHLGGGGEKWRERLNERGKGLGD